MEILPKANVLKRLQALIDKHGTQAKAAKVIGCSPSQLSQAVKGSIPLTASMLKALRIARAPLYVSGVSNVPQKYLDGFTGSQVRE